MNPQVRGAVCRIREIFTRFATSAGRALLWPVGTRLRMIVHAWMIAYIIVGNAASASAADGFIIAPDLGSAGGKTLFETFDVTAFTYPVDTNSDHDGLESPMWNLVNAAATMITWLSLSLLRGALVALQWMLDLTIYDDQSAVLDDAMASLAASIFLPLLGMTLAIAGFTIYIKGRRDGGGVIGELASMLAATVFALTIVMQPSAVLDTVDNARASMSNAMMSSYSKVASPTDSSTGFPTPDTGSDRGGAIRQLTDSLWNTYGVAPWCYTAWASVDSCAIVGQQYLEDAEATSGPWGDAKTALESDGDVDPFGEDTGWVRGQEAGRLGAALLLGFVGIVAAGFLLALFVFGLMSAIGVIILLFIGLVFLLGIMIPGRPRAMGVRWIEALLGTFIQSLLITAVVGAVMVVGSVFNGAIGQYGIFGTALLNLVALILGLRYRQQFEHMVGFGTSATGNSVMSSYMAARMITGGARAGARMLGGAAGGAGRVAAAATAPAAYAGGKAAHGVQTGYRAARNKLAPLRPASAPAGTGAGSTGPGRAPTSNPARTTGAPASAQTTAAATAQAASPATGTAPSGGHVPARTTAQGAAPKAATPPPPPGTRRRSTSTTSATPSPATPTSATPTSGGTPVSRPAVSTGGTPPPPASAAPRMAAPHRAPRPAPSGSTPPPPPASTPATAAPRMATPGRRYRVTPVSRGGDQ